MTARLAQSPRLFTLVRDLGLKPSDNLVRDILRFCDLRISDLVADFSDRRNPSAVLEWIASKLGTRFEMVWSDADLIKLQEKYVALGEVGFVDLFNELSDDVFGITVRRHKQQPHEPPFVSVIDCRGDKGSRRYFTKWHEVAHLITMTDQLRLVFRRTNCSGQNKDPEEALMDIIAGQFGFRPPADFAFNAEEISFEAIDNLRQQLCPEASNQAALISFIKFWPSPCMLVTARMAMRKRDEVQRLQSKFDFAEAPAQQFRAVRVTQSDIARELGFAIFRNMRVPESSVIHRVYSDGVAYLEAKENLDIWESSDGRVLAPCAVEIKARKSWDGVEALVTPVSGRDLRKDGH
jgi:hypothetical protein